jgi:hypothetical protein
VDHPPLHNRRSQTHAKNKRTCPGQPGKPLPDLHDSGSARLDAGSDRPGDFRQPGRLSAGTHRRGGARPGRDRAGFLPVADSRRADVRFTLHGLPQGKARLAIGSHRFAGLCRAHDLGFALFHAAAVAHPHRAQPEPGQGRNLPRLHADGAAGAGHAPPPDLQARRCFLRPVAAEQPPRAGRLLLRRHHRQHHGPLGRAQPAVRTGRWLPWHRPGRPVQGPAAPGLQGARGAGVAPRALLAGQGRRRAGHRPRQPGGGGYRRTQPHRHGITARAVCPPARRGHPAARA